LLGSHARGGHGLMAIAQDGIVEKDRFHILKPCSFCHRQASPASAKNLEPVDKTHQPYFAVLIARIVGPEQ
jgi:hypothetical protein